MDACLEPTSIIETQDIEKLQTNIRRQYYFVRAGKNENTWAPVGKENLLVV